MVGENRIGKEEIWWGEVELRKAKGKGVRWREGIPLPNGAHAFKTLIEKLA